MIKIDVSNLLPKQMGTYLLGIIPGFVFEVTMAYGNPPLAHSLVERVKQVYPFQGYALLALFAVSCLFVGQTFHFMGWFVDWTVDLLYKLARYSIFNLTLGSNWLYKALGRWQGMPPKRLPQILLRLIMPVRMQRWNFKHRPILVCQRRAALQLLRRKYGITLPEGYSPAREEEWQAWLAVLGKPPGALRESFVLMRITVGCALAELASLYLCADLQNRYFATMCAVLLLASLLQMISFVRRRNEPILFSLTRLATLVEELAEQTPAGEKGGEGTAKHLLLQETDADGG